MLMKMKTSFNFFFLIFFISIYSYGNYILIPMDKDSQANHLKAYGIAYWVLQNNLEVDWLLNYRGGSFLIKSVNEISSECIYRGVSFEILSNNDVNNIFNSIFKSNDERIIIEKSFC